MKKFFALVLMVGISGPSLSSAQDGEDDNYDPESRETFTVAGVNSCSRYTEPGKEVTGYMCLTAHQTDDINPHLWQFGICHQIVRENGTSTYAAFPAESIIWKLMSAGVDLTKESVFDVENWNACVITPPIDLSGPCNASYMIEASVRVPECDTQCEYLSGAVTVTHNCPAEPPGEPPAEPVVE